MEYKVNFAQRDLRRALENAIQVTSKVPKNKLILRHVKVSVPGIGNGIEVLFEATDGYVLFRQEVGMHDAHLAAPRSDDGWHFSLDHDSMKQIVANIKSVKYDGNVEFRFFDEGFDYTIGSKRWSETIDWKFAADQFPTTQLVVDGYEPGNATRLSVNSKVLTTIHKIRGGSHMPRTGERFQIHPAKDYLHKPFKVILGNDVTLYVMPQREP